MDRERRVDQIRDHADKLHELARRYDRLRWLAEQETSTDAFLDLAAAAGELSVSSLEQMATLLELLRRAWETAGEVDA